MRSIWMGIDPREDETLVLATAGPSKTLLKARLSPRAMHPRAVPTLLEALALWEGAPVRAALCVDVKDPSAATRLSLDAFADFDASPLYQLEFVRRPRRQSPPADHIAGMGDFRDVKQLLLWEVAR